MPPWHRCTLDDQDMAQIQDLLSHGLGTPPHNGQDALSEFNPSLQELFRTLNVLRSFVDKDQTIGATHIRNSLLDIWSAAHELDPQLCQLVEELLTGLVSRDLVRADEINDLCDKTEWAANQHARRVSG